MSWYSILLLFSIFLGSISLAYQIYKITEKDAEFRGLKHPKLWGLFSTGGQNCGGLLLYLIGRNRYPSSMTEPDRAIIDARIKKAGVSLILLTAAAIGLFAVLIINL